MQKAKVLKGSLTEWITCCRCDVVKPTEGQSKTINFGTTCGKQIREGRVGSFTQFIFRHDLCACDKKKIAYSILKPPNLVPTRCLSSDQTNRLFRKNDDGNLLDKEEPYEDNVSAAKTPSRSNQNKKTKFTFAPPVVPLVLIAGMTVALFGKKNVDGKTTELPTAQFPSFKKCQN
jgi:hypothetical protein